MRLVSQLSQHHFDLLSKVIVGLESMSEPECYGDLVCKFYGDLVCKFYGDLVCTFRNVV